MSSVTHNTRGNRKKGVPRKAHTYRAARRNAAKDGDVKFPWPNPLTLQRPNTSPIKPNKRDRTRDNIAKAPTTDFTAILTVAGHTMGTFLIDMALRHRRRR